MRLRTVFISLAISLAASALTACTLYFGDDSTRRHGPQDARGATPDGNVGIPPDGWPEYPDGWPQVPDAWWQQYPDAFVQLPDAAPDAAPGCTPDAPPPPPPDACCNH